MTGACVLERVERRKMNFFDVLPVDVQRVHSEGDGALRQISDRLVLRLRRRLRPAVVLADEDGRQPPQLSEIQRLVEGADVGRAVAEEGERDARLVRAS